MKYRLQLIWIVLVLANVANGNEMEDPLPRTVATPFLRYSKPTVMFFPKKNSLVSRDNGDTLVLQPNVAPEIGLSVSRDKFTVAYARSRREWQRDQESRGQSDTSHIEVHWLDRTIGLDLYRSSSRGFFSDPTSNRDIGILGDRLFRRAKSPEQLTQTSLTLTGARMVLAPMATETDLRGVLEPKLFANHTTWSPLLMGEVFSLQMNGPDTLLNQDLQNKLPEIKETTGASLHCFGIAPGLAAIYKIDRWHISGAGFWGYSLLSLSVRKGESPRRLQAAPTGNLRMSAGYISASHALGIKGYKTIISPSLKNGGLAFTASMVEIYYHYSM